ncbi:MAG: DMT family transporter [bacterium]|nr:DMT family transporter [Candidatus Kapabacteria bacterium]
MSKQRKAELMLLLTTVIWGATFSITKYIVDAGVDPMAQVAWRFVIATVLFLLLFGRRVTLRPTRATTTHGVILGALLFVGFSLQAVGLRLTSSSRSGFITVLYVVFTPLLAIIITRRAPSRNVIIAIVLVLLGLWGLTAPGGRVEGLVEPWLEGGFNVGDLLTLVSAIIWAIYITLLDRFTSSGDVTTLTAIQLIVVATAAAIYIGAASSLGAPLGSLTIPMNVIAWSGMFYLAFFSTVLSTYWQTLYQRETSPSRAAVIFTLEAVFAAMIAAIFLNETLTPLALFGGALIIAGLLVVEFRGNAQMNQ